MNKKEWLIERKNGIGASESACILGLNPYKTNVRLWEEKTGRIKPDDLSENIRVNYGTDAEKHLRELFKLDFPQYKVDFNEYKIIRNPECPFIFATLDGELTDENKRKGILEIKTTEISNSTEWAKWKDGIPQGYYIQVLHQLLATGYDFVVLKAQIKTNYNNELKLETRHYFIERNEVESEIEYLKQKLIEFWNENVLKDVRPNQILPPI